MNTSSRQSEAVRAVDFKRLLVSSPAFEDGGPIPAKYTCDGKNINPPLDIRYIPEESVCLALIMDDPDAPSGTWVHWVVWNIPVAQHIAENKIHGMQGINDFGAHQYRGPCPPSGTHRYFLKVYALDSLLELPADSRKQQVEKAMSGHIIAFGECSGRYERK